MKRFYVWLWGRSNRLAIWSLRQADKRGYGRELTDQRTELQQERRDYEAALRGKQATLRNERG